MKIYHYGQVTIQRFSHLIVWTATLPLILLPYAYRPIETPYGSYHQTIIRYREAPVQKVKVVIKRSIPKFPRISKRVFPPVLALMPIQMDCIPCLSKP